MSRHLFVLFLSIFILLTSLVLDVSLTNYTWLSYSGYFGSFLLLIIWVFLKRKNLVRILNFRGTQYGIQSSFNAILFLIAMIGVCFLSNKPRFNLTFDVSRDGINTLTTRSTKIINKFDKSTPLYIAAFFLDENKKNKFHSTISLYQSEGLRTEIEFVNPKTDPIRAIDEKIGEQDVAVFQYQGKKSQIREFNEEKITNTLYKILNPEKKIVYLVEGHGERSIDSKGEQGISGVAEQLHMENYIVKKINLLEVSDIPKDASLVAIVGPRYDFKDQENIILDRYLLSGGSALFMLDAMTDIKRLSSLVAEYGIKINSDFLLLRPDDSRSKILGQNNALITDFDQLFSVTKSFSDDFQVAIISPNSRSIKSLEKNKNNMNPNLVANTSDVIISITGVESQKDLSNLSLSRVRSGPFSVIGFSSGLSKGDEFAKSDLATSSKDLVDAINVSKEIRIGVFGSSGIVSNLGLQSQENVDLFLNSVNYLIHDDEFISIRPRSTIASKLDVSSSISQVLLLFISYLYPTIFLGAGVFLWVRRRRL